MTQYSIEISIDASMPDNRIIPRFASGLSARPPGAFAPGRRYSDVVIPMLSALLPVSAPSDNDWALGVGSLPASEFPTLSETARPVNAGSLQSSEMLRDRESLTLAAPAPFSLSPAAPFLFFRPGARRARVPKIGARAGALPSAVLASSARVPTVMGDGP